MFDSIDWYSFTTLDVTEQILQWSVGLCECRLCGLHQASLSCASCLHTFALTLISFLKKAGLAEGMTKKKKKNTRLPRGRSKKSVMNAGKFLFEVSE